MATVHQKRSDLKASVWGAALRAAADGLLLAVLAVGAGWLAVRWPSWLMMRLAGEVRCWQALTAAGIMLAIVLALRLRKNRRERQIRRAGVQGEEAALRQLAQALGSAYHVYSNVRVTWQGRASEMDMVLIGPAGVSVVEVKNYAGEISGAAHDRFLTRVKQGQEETIYNPIKQVATHVYRLSGFLREAGCGTWVRGFVFFVNPRTRVTLTGASDAEWYTASEVGRLAKDLCTPPPGEAPLTHRQVEKLAVLMKKL